MDPHTVEVTIKIYLKQMRERLERAASIAKAAEACAEAGDVERAVIIILDVEQPLYEATTLLNAASLLNRCVAER